VVPWDIVAVQRRGPSSRSIAWQRAPLGSLLVAAALLPALASISIAQTVAGAPPVASTKPTPVVTPKTTTVWLNPSAAPPSVTIARTLPDPYPLSEKDQWIYDLRYVSGDLYLLGIHHLELAGPQATPRVMGRFALELYEGATLVERARFDFPMLGDVAPVGATQAAKSSIDRDAGPNGGRERSIHGPPPSFATKLVTRIGVMFPASKRGTKLVIVDRATDTRWPLPWPPVEMTSSVPDRAADAGSSDGG
jgi:hypothetical protein